MIYIIKGSPIKNNERESRANTWKIFIMDQKFSIINVK